MPAVWNAGDDRRLSVALSTLWYHRRRLDLTFKKNSEGAEQARPDVSLGRACWQAWQPRWDPARLVFVDETGLIAPMVTTGAMTGTLFLADVKDFLCPSLTAGDLVVWDNLSAHGVAGVREAIEACGATLQPLPPYSPDFNPIEQVFAKLKAKRRAHGRRTLEDLGAGAG